MHTRPGRTGHAQSRDDNKNNEVAGRSAYRALWLARYGCTCARFAVKEVINNSRRANDEASYTPEMRFAVS